MSRIQTSTLAHTRGFPPTAIAVYPLDFCYSSQLYTALNFYSTLPPRHPAPTRSLYGGVADDEAVHAARQRNGGDVALVGLRQVGGDLQGEGLGLGFEGPVLCVVRLVGIESGAGGAVVRVGVSVTGGAVCHGRSNPQCTPLAPALSRLAS